MNNEHTWHLWATGPVQRPVSRHTQTLPTYRRLSATSQAKQMMMLQFHLINNY